MSGKKAAGASCVMVKYASCACEVRIRFSIAEQAAICGFVEVPVPNVPLELSGYWIISRVEGLAVALSLEIGPGACVFLFVKQPHLLVFARSRSPRDIGLVNLLLA
jgi:hypothetical protein